MQSKALAADVGEGPLDPVYWSSFRIEAHRALDTMMDHVEHIRERPVWREMPRSSRDRFSEPPPRQPTDLGAVLARFETDILPYGTGNIHPAFCGWAHGAGTPFGMVADLLAAGLNANCGGRNHVGVHLESTITAWVAELIGFPPDASGLITSGASMANFIGLAVARTQALGASVRTAGLRSGDRQLVAYTSEHAHGCLRRAMELLGIGGSFLRLVPALPSGAMDGSALADMLVSDRRDGKLPFAVCASAGTVDWGAFDDMTALAQICRRECLWLHVDAAFGATCAASPALRHHLDGIEQADSVALDFHKWFHVPYDAGFLLCRHHDVHRSTFADEQRYLARLPSGLAAGDAWPVDYGPELSRGFRALKIWLTLTVVGLDAIGRSAKNNVALAARFAQLIENCEALELRAPVPLNIVCFGVRGSDGEAERELVMRLHDSGLAAPSLTRIAGRDAVRCAFFNHRTKREDVDRLFAEILAGLPHVS